MPFLVYLKSHNIDVTPNFLISSIVLVFMLKKVHLFIQLIFVSDTYEQITPLGTLDRKCIYSVPSSLMSNSVCGFSQDSELV